MSTTLPPIPQKSKMVDDSGLITPAWSGFFRELFRRVGGTLALSNIEIAQTLGVTPAPAPVVSQVTAPSALQIQIDYIQKGPLP